MIITDRIGELVLGIVVVAIVCFDVFHTIIVPRMSLRRARIAPLLVGEIMWPSYRWLVRRLPQSWQVGWLEVFAPSAFLVLLFAWLACMIVGFAFIFFSLGIHLNPPVHRISDAAYLAGGSVLTLGLGDVVAKNWPARGVVLLAAVLGLIFMALVVSLLFSMLSYLQTREEVVNTLMSRAGSPPSGVVLLMRYRELNIVPNLSGSFVGWEQWIASILESHRGFPLLMYFRSSMAETSWMAATGATLDAASLLLTSIEKDWIGEADLYYWMGVSALKLIAEAFLIKPVEDTTVTKKDYVDALELLHSAGFEVRDAERMWPYFQARRSGYMRYLIPLANHFEQPMHVWLPSFKRMIP